MMETINSRFPFGSWVYRAGLIFLLLYICLDQPNILPIWSYWVGFIGYLCLCSISYSFSLPILRTIADYGLIGLVLIGKELCPINYFIVLYPLISSTIYRGRHKGYTLIVLVTIGMLWYFLGAGFLGASMPVVVLVVFGKIFETWRSWNDISMRLANHVDEYFSNQTVIQKPHAIYGNIMGDLNEYLNKYAKFNNPKCVTGIYAYSLQINNKMYLINGSSFKWDRTLNLKEDIIDRLKRKGFYTNIDEENNCIAYYYVELPGSKYIFQLYICDSIMFRLLLNLGFRTILSSICCKIAYLLNVEFRLSKHREDKLNELRDNIEYVNSAVKLMHFIRNRLTPMSNVLAVSKLPVEKMTTEIMSLYKKQIQQAELDLKEINKMAEHLLDESHNPFSVGTTESISIEKLYIILSESAQNHLDIIVERLSDIPSETLCLKANLYDLKLFITDWTRNMQKHGSGDYRITFELQDRSILVKFWNKLNRPADIKYLLDLINNKDKDSVIKRKTHGISSMKEIANRWNISMHAIWVDKEGNPNTGSVCLTVKFVIDEKA